MAAAGNKSSGWGSFLQQAVAGVEAHLDNILAEDAQEHAQPPFRTLPSSQFPAVARSAPTSRHSNDHLQKRLQRAVAVHAAARATPNVSPKESLEHDLNSLPLKEKSEPRTAVPTWPPAELNKTTVHNNVRTQNCTQDGTTQVQNLAKPLAPPTPASRPGTYTDVVSEPALNAIQCPTATINVPSVDQNQSATTNDTIVITTFSSLESELARLQSDLQAKKDQVSSLESKLHQALSSLAIANKMATAVAKSENERQKISELEEIVASLEVEKRLASERAGNRVAELKEQLKRANEHARSVELKSKADLRAVENRLETLRARVEEATTGSQPDSETKLLRQLETLQVQYASASENWQGIERTLLSRITGLETEMDEALRRECDMRRKARDAAARAQRLEEDLEDTRTNSPTIDHIHRQHQIELAKIQRRAEIAELALAQAKAEAERQRHRSPQVVKEETQYLPDTEQRGWLDDPPSSLRTYGCRPYSSQLSVPSRTFSSDHLGASLIPRKVKKPSSSSSNCELSPSVSGQPTRRPSVLNCIQSLVSPDGVQHASPPCSTAFCDIETPPRPPDDKDDVSEPIEFVTPGETIQEVASISTVAAGPSVQLVERMSSAIRGLESEKVATREELSRISGQRDDARNEIVALMKDVEMGRAATLKVTDLEAQLDDLNQRYQTTLELLGEKSELVDELRADVADVKQMYRDLVERTVR